MGLENRWEMWLRKDQSVAVISIRGTTIQSVSWLANFYAAMIPASGTMQLNASTSFQYSLAADTTSYVHVGWTFAVAYIAPDIVKKIKEYYRQGVKQFIIVGHSQGAALAFLLRPYLYYLEPSVLPQDIIYKTYCSAAPKPGNLYYAYDFDFITRGGWGFRLVNAVDWVPEMPFCVQTINDLNAVNPFQNVKASLKKEPLLVRLYAHSVLNKINRSSKKLASHYKKYLGDAAGRQVEKIYPQYKSPDFVDSNNYIPAGSPVILVLTEDYKKAFIYNGKNIFVNHLVPPYYFLSQFYFGN